MSELKLSFRRRCGWCGVNLRAWQLNLCRLCKGHINAQMSAPCGQGQRWDKEPDRIVF